MNTSITSQASSPNSSACDGMGPAGQESWTPTRLPACTSSWMAVQHCHTGFLPKINRSQEHQPLAITGLGARHRGCLWKSPSGNTPDLGGGILHAIRSSCYHGLDCIYFHLTSSASHPTSLTYLHCYLVHNRAGTQTYQQCNLCKTLSAAH